MLSTRVIRLTRALGISFAASTLLACGTPPPSDELVAARQTYQQAASSNAAELVPDQLLGAKQALDQAETAHNDDPESFEERSLAYIAQRKAQLAMALAGQAAARKDADKSEAEYLELQDKLRKSAMSDADKLRRKMAQQGSELAKERKARLAAEKKYLAAMKSLEEIAKIKEEQRGLVITLSGAVLFTTGKADLLPIAREKLDKVAEVLQQQDPNKTITVEGHTDSVGSEAANLRLSQRRADVVRDYLVSQGVDSKVIRAVGKGESTPVASNRTADGRANNRRVEIVVK
jgi:outer membrane protein OmpA-like peptidoglycan-associated protein